MKKIKFSVCIILAAVMIIGAALPAGITLPALPQISASAAESGVCGDGVTYTLDNAGKLTITGRGSVSSEFFNSRTDIKEVEIKSGITDIGAYTFENCSELTSVKIPEGVTDIFEKAFHKCVKLTSVSIPNSVTCIYDYAFAFCDNLASVNLPAKLAEIGGAAFNGCKKLTSANIPDGVTEIGMYAFSDCIGLTSVKIPASVTAIGEGAFSGCSKLSSVSVDKNNPVYDSRNNCNAIIETNTNTLIAGCNVSFIPDGVTGIGESAFAFCENLTSVNIPSTLSKIGGAAFYGCKKLTSVKIPDGVTEIGMHAFCDCLGLTSVKIPASVTSIGESAFEGCPGLTSVKIPASVTGIGESAFEGCSGLTSVTLPAGVKNISGYAFSGCSKLETVYYEGTPEQKTQIEINNNNTPLTAARWKYLRFRVKAPDIVLKGTTVGQLKTAISAYIAGGSCTVAIASSDGIYDTPSSKLANNVKVKITGRTSADITTGDWYDDVPSNWTVSPVSSSSGGYTCSAIISYSLHTHSISKQGSNAATCIADGNTEYYKCSTCGKYYKDADGKNEITLADTVIPKLAHSFTAKKTDAKYLASAATKSAPAKYYYSCSGCGAKGTATFEYGSKLPAACAHQWDSGKITKAPTYKEDGVKTYTCPLCRETKTEKIKPKYLIGDIDGDNTVQVGDARLVLRAAINLEKLDADRALAADVDGDGEIKVGDAREVLRAAINLIKVSDFSIFKK